jgi:SAM-dependent methyltransferase
VVDVASGTGYGCEILLDTGADAALGIDLDASALRYAASRSRASFVEGDASRLPLRSHSVEALTSFETIEHVARANVVLDEFARVLRKGGLLVLSTPNALVTRPVAGRPRNPFHVHEFEPDELNGLLTARFSSVRLFGQHVHPRFPRMPLLAPRRAAEGWRDTAWRLRHATVPFAVNDRLARLRHNRGFYPGEFDYLFREGDVVGAHVLVAICSS